MLELRLRHWLAAVLGSDCLQWVEPARGSTVGAGDAIIKLPRKGYGSLSVELKIWELKTKGLCCPMRPAQIRYHFMSWKRRAQPTAIIFAIDGEVYVIAGKYVPKDKYDHLVAETMVHICAIDQEISKPHFFRCMVKAFSKEVAP